MRLNLCLLTFLTLVVSAIAEEGNVEPLRHAHAHNDYRHPRPLTDAIAHGFCSVEADIFLVDGALLIGHDRSELHDKRTLQALYLDPLQEIADRHGGRVYPDGPAFTLLIDIKTDGESTYAVLRDVLRLYPDLISSVSESEFQQRAVDVVISGNRPIEIISAEKTRYAGIDGRLSDLESAAPPHLMPLISDRWTSHFQWRGRGEFPADQRDKLREIVRLAHSRGRRVRFWATPEEPTLWQELLAAGVDHINTDKLAALNRFLLEQR